MFDACSEDFVEDITTCYSRLIPLVHKGNRLNFAKNSNRGLRWAYERRHGVLLVNQDCVLPSYQYIEAMVSAEGIVTPYSQDKAKIQEELDELMDPSSGRDQDYPSWELELTETKEKFPFYCPFIPYKVLDKVGVLDEVYTASFEDDNYISRVLLAGFTNYKANIPVYHEGSHTDTSGSNWESASGAYNASTLGFSFLKYKSQFRIPPEVPHHECIDWILKHHEFDKEIMCIR